MRIISFLPAYNGVMLTIIIPQFYKVKRGQTLKEISARGGYEGAAFGKRRKF